MAYYSGNPYERYMILNRHGRPVRTLYWALIFCNILSPQALWFRKVRRSVPALFVVSP